MNNLKPVKRCNHVIGYEYALGGGEFIYKSNRKEIEERGYHTLEYFDYCHNCGKKLNKPKDEQPRTKGKDR